MVDQGFIERLSARMAEVDAKARPLSKKSGLNETAVRDLIQGRVKSPTIATIKSIAAQLNVSASWLAYGEGEKEARILPVVSYIGAGAEVYAIDDHAKGEGIDEIPAPPGSGPSAVGVIVRGDSMWPKYEDGDVLVYDERRPPEDLLGKSCVVELEDGRVLVKKIKRGAGDSFTLVSHNAPDIEDVYVRWAAPVAFVIPG